jgi:hypothetical protein
MVHVQLIPITLPPNAVMSSLKPTIKEKAQMNAWRKDQRMVFLANPGRDLTAKERKEWERTIHNYQIK